MYFTFGCPHLVNKGCSMTKKRIRIRYRRIFVFKPYRFTYKSKAPIQITKNQETTPELEKQKAKIMHKPNNQIEVAPEPTNQVINAKRESQLASFDPDYNPYAYLLSQLPNMLNAIPNLLGEPDKTNTEEDSFKNVTCNNEDKTSKVKETTFIDLNNCEKSYDFSDDVDQNTINLNYKSIIDSARFARKKEHTVDKIIKDQPDFLTNKIKNHSKNSKSHNTLCLIGWQTMPNKVYSKIENYFLHTKNAHLSACSKKANFTHLAIRFGGPVKQIKVSDNTNLKSHSPLFQTIKQLANEQKISLPWLCLILSSVQEIRSLLQHSTYEQVHNELKGIKSTTLNSFSLKQYFKATIEQKKLQENLNLLPMCLSMFEIKQHNTTQLHHLKKIIEQHYKTYISSSKEQLSYILNIKIGRHNFNIEIVKNSVFLYLASRTPIHYEFELFMLQFKQLINSLNPSKRCFLTLYTQPDNFKEKLHDLYVDKHCFWETYLNHNFYSFVSST